MSTVTDTHQSDWVAYVHMGTGTYAKCRPCGWGSPIHPDAVDTTTAVIRHAYDCPATKLLVETTRTCDELLDQLDGFIADDTLAQPLPGDPTWPACTGLADLIRTAVFDALHSDEACRFAQEATR